MHLRSYLHSAQQILTLYEGNVPLAAWLKLYFKEHKKYGSKDRRHITHLLYCYFRLGNAFHELPVEERLKLGLYLCADAPNDLLQAVNESWNQLAPLPAAEKLQRFEASNQILNIFPFNAFLSPQIDTADFNLHFLQQPPVYLRLRPGKEQKVKETFLQRDVPFTEIDSHCIAVNPNTKVDALINLNADAVVQDRSSQQVLSVLDSEALKGKINIWDCCAASGGKSILAWDAFEHVALTVSDVRESILHNLQNRFAQAGIRRYRSLVADVSKASPLKEKFDLVICDAPCSGSGTWGRTPEQLRFFTEDRIDHYTQLQKSIAINAAKNVKRGGQLLYITCSVFEAENEAIVQFIQETTKLTLHRQAYFKGYDKAADTLFAAAFAAL